MGGERCGAYPAAAQAVYRVALRNLRARRAGQQHPGRGEAGVLGPGEDCDLAHARPPVRLASNTMATLPPATTPRTTAHPGLNPASVAKKTALAAATRTDTVERREKGALEAPGCERRGPPHFGNNAERLPGYAMIPLAGVRNYIGPGEQRARHHPNRFRPCVRPDAAGFRHATEGGERRLEGRVAA